MTLFHVVEGFLIVVKNILLVVKNILLVVKNILFVVKNILFVVKNILLVVKNILFVVENILLVVKNIFMVVKNRLMVVEMISQGAASIPQVMKSCHPGGLPPRVQLPDRSARMMTSSPAGTEISELTDETGFSSVPLNHCDIEPGFRQINFACWS